MRRIWRVFLGWDADIARCADVDVELAVRADGDELPAVRLMIGQVVVDDDELRRIVEVVLDLFELRDLGTFGDVQCAVVEGEPVRPIQPRGDDLHLAFAVPIGDGIDLVEHTVTDKHGPLVTEPQRARIGDAAGIDLDFEALGQLELGDRQLVRRCRKWRRRDAAQLGRHFGVGDVGTPGHRGGLRLHAGCRCCPPRCFGRLGCRRG